MFRILKYSHDQINDTLEIRVAFQTKVNSEVIQDGGHFSKKYDGDKWLRQLQKDYLTIRLENYIRHKKHIIEAPMQGHKSLTLKKVVLDELERLVVWSVEKATLGEACKWVLLMKKKLQTILPSQSNPSYQSSCDELELLIEFARSITQTALKKAS